MEPSRFDRSGRIENWRLDSELCCRCNSTSWRRSKANERKAEDLPLIGLVRWPWRSARVFVSEWWRTLENNNTSSYGHCVRYITASHRISFSSRRSRQIHSPCSFVNIWTWRNCHRFGFMTTNSTTEKNKVQKQAPKREEGNCDFRSASMSMLLENRRRMLTGRPWILWQHAK